MQITSNLEAVSEATLALRASLTPGQVIKSYINLMKPHVTTLLVAVTALTMVIAARGMPAAGLLVATLLGGLMATGSANAINCYIDRDIDQLMGRTIRRSVPSGKVPPHHALIFGLVLAVASFVEMVVFVNLLAASLALSGILFYVFVYTMGLKRTTHQNIVIGGAAGGVPALVGWAAVTGTVSLPAFLLFAIIFYWTPPHFWALALLIKADYARAGVPMLPVVLGDAETRKQIFLYSWLLLGVSLLLFATGTMGYLYLASAILLGGVMLYFSWRLLRTESKRWAHRMFWFSNSYLALLFAVMAIDSVVR